MFTLTINSLPHNIPDLLRQVANDMENGEPIEERKTADVYAERGDYEGEWNFSE